MHYLHKILVEVDGTESKNEIRELAFSMIENYQGNVFDYITYRTAGRWVEEYPDNVILGSENVEAMIKAITESKENQENEIKECLEALGTDSIEDIMKSTNRMKHYYLYKLAKLNAGYYDCDSFFFNALNGDVTINDELFDYIREHKDNLALVMVDIHA